VIASDTTEAYQLGVAYLERVRSVLPDPQMVDVMGNLRDRVSICNWIGTQIETVNRSLQVHLNACHDCFNPIVGVGDSLPLGTASLEENRQSIQILAVPFASSVQLDGFCNINTAPTTILVDVGRVAPADWLALVAHEYAHAYLGYPGHDREYAQVLSHLCLGLGFAQPSFQPEDRSIYCWPLYSPSIDPLAWWRGEGSV
jgi:hypothetical protein